MQDGLRHLSVRAAAAVAAALVAAAETLADSAVVRNVIALGALVAALAVIWAKVIRPAIEYVGLPDRMDRLEESHDRLLEAVAASTDQVRLVGLAIAEVQRTVETHIVP